MSFGVLYWIRFVREPFRDRNHAQPLPFLSRTCQYLCKSAAECYRPRVNRSMMQSSCQKHVLGRADGASRITLTHDSWICNCFRRSATLRDARPCKNARTCETGLRTCCRPSTQKLRWVQRWFFVSISFYIFQYFISFWDFRLERRSWTREMFPLTTRKK